MDNLDLFITRRTVEKRLCRFFVFFFPFRLPVLVAQELIEKIVICECKLCATYLWKLGFFRLSWNFVAICKKKKGIFFDVANGRGNRHLPIYSILSLVLFWGAHIHFNRTHLYVPEFNDRKRFS